LFQVIIWRIEVFLKNHGNPPKIRLKTYLLPALTGLALLMQLADPYKGWTLLLTGLGGLWLVSYLWTRELARQLQLVREMRYGWAQVGDQLEERFTLRNEFWLPALWVEIIDHSDIPGYQASQATGVDARASIKWRTRGVCTRRGIFTLGPTSLRTGDPFGIYTVSLEYTASATLTVMPPIVPLPKIEVAPGGKTGEGRPRSNAPERTVSSSTVREYEPGDSLHLIHWKTTARIGSPYVRIFDGTPAGDWWIILDMDRKVQIGQGWDATEEHEVILAASLADRGLRLRRAVGLVSDGQELVWLPPQEGKVGTARRWETMHALALLSPGERTLHDLLLRARSSIGNRSSIIIITPNCTMDWIEALVPMLWRGIVATVLLLDPVSFGGTQSAAPALHALAQLGVSRYLITRDVLNRPEAHPGEAGKWEWRVLPTGRAVAIKRPSNTTWKALS
jgi:uncharacterized protein (DUF58 family)